jgi:hypothetical protein
MTEHAAQQPQVVAPEPAPPGTELSPTEPHMRRRVYEWFRPPAEPKPLRFDETSDELLARLGKPNGQVIDELLLEAQAAYAEVSERADSAERRATTIQGSIAVMASLSLAGGSLLLGKVPTRGWAIALGGGLAVTVLVLAIAAWRALLVTSPRYRWASPAVPEIVDHARKREPDAIKLQRTRDLLISYGRNDSIARLKINLLGQAVRWLVGALGLLVVLAGMLSAYAIHRSTEQPSSKSSTSPGTTTHTTTRRP